MSIWKKEFTLEGINNIIEPCMPYYLGIEFIDIGDDFLVARMPVNERTKQPMGLLHGGASVVLAETIGACLAYCALKKITKRLLVLK